jgi:hypothetical protein
MADRSFRDHFKIDYYVLNDGSDENEPSSKRVKEASNAIDSESFNTTEDVIVPSESASQGPALIGDGELSTISTPSRAKTSSVWEYFDRIELDKMWVDGNGNQRKDYAFSCKLCRPFERPSYTMSHQRGSTSVLKRHLQKKHGLQKSDEGNSLITQFVREGEVSKKGNVKDNLLKWIVTTSQPFTVVQDPNFQELFMSVGGTIPIKSGNGIKYALEEKYRELLAKRLEVLSQTDSRKSLSVDCWTSSTGASFMAIIGHFIGNDFTYFEMLLDFTEIAGEHTGIVLADNLRACIAHWKLEGRIIAITGDNASNNEAMINVGNSNVDDAY